MSAENKSLKLSDATIGQVAKVLQLAILSGTDVVDHLRQMRLVNEGGELELSTDYAHIFEDNLDTMMQEIVLNNGSSIFGKIIYQDHDVMKIETLIGQLIIDRNTIVRVVNQINSTNNLPLFFFALAISLTSSLTNVLEIGRVGHTP